MYVVSPDGTPAGSVEAGAMVRAQASADRKRTLNTSNSLYFWVIFSLSRCVFFDKTGTPKLSGQTAARFLVKLFSDHELAGDANIFYASKQRSASIGC
jgi:hypothetical protein